MGFVLTLSFALSWGAISPHFQPYLSVGLGGEVLGDRPVSFSGMSMSAMWAYSMLWWDPDVKFL